MKLVEFHIQIKLMILLILAFIIATVFGTLSHEFGHFCVAKFNGQNARVAYGYCSSDPRSSNTFKEYQKFVAESKNSNSPEEIEKLNEYRRQIDRDNINMIFGGPIQTMLFGSIGFILLFVFRQKFNNIDKLKIWQWLLVFLSLFWLRETFNMCTGIVYMILQGSVHIHSISDEVIIERYFNLPFFSLEATLGIIGLILGIITVFKFVPIKERLTFIISGFIGGLTGAYFWLILLGPKILP